VRVVHHPRHHAAVRTTEYVYSQLIPYIGNKRKLVPLIATAIRSTGISEGTFVDLFSGSTAVARLAKRMGHRVVANDWEPYAHEIARGTVAVNHRPAFRRLGDVDRVFAMLNTAAPVHGYIARHLCPADDDAPDPATERMFFTRENGERIDAMRELIAQWQEGRLLTRDERAYLLSALVYAVSYVSNTSGVFKGFHHGWGGKTGTALYRIRSRIALQPPVLLDNGRDNVALGEDARLLCPRLSRVCGGTPDIVYLDPPYNQHPYGSNYHVLNTVVLWDKPPLARSIRVDGRVVDKAAIRKDWRTERRSPFNSARHSPAAFADLVGALDARWILVSYSTDGNIDLGELLEVLSRRGAVSVHCNRYKRYRVSTPRRSARSHTVEFVAVVDTARRPRRPAAARLARLVAAVEEERSGDDR
jgi:adenine-specific DNA-methyltransferase